MIGGAFAGAGFGWGAFRGLRCLRAKRSWWHARSVERVRESKRFGDSRADLYDPLKARQPALIKSWGSLCRNGPTSDVCLSSNGHHLRASLCTRLGGWRASRQAPAHAVTCAKVASPFRSGPDLARPVKERTRRNPRRLSSQSRASALHAHLTVEGLEIEPRDDSHTISPSTPPRFASTKRRAYPRAESRATRFALRLARRFGP